MKTVSQRQFTGIYSWFGVVFCWIHVYYNQVISKERLLSPAFLSATPFSLFHLNKVYTLHTYVHYIYWSCCAYADLVPLYSQFIGQLILLVKLSIRFALLLLFGNSRYMQATSLDAKLFKNYVVIHNTMQLCKTKASLWLLEGPIRICTTVW